MFIIAPAEFTHVNNYNTLNVFDLTILNNFSLPVSTHNMHEGMSDLFPVFVDIEMHANQFPKNTFSSNEDSYR